MDGLINSISNNGRKMMSGVARGLNKITFGKLHPNVITYTGLIAHFFIAWVISEGNFELAALALVFFGLFDALDGALARIQKRAGNAGMLLDAVTDRMKEVLLYIGVVSYFSTEGEAGFVLWAVAALGGSILVSYVKAKGETAVKDTRLSPNEINRLFGDGLMRFEVRMFTLILGLALNQLGPAVVIIAILTWLTAFQRLFRITKKLA